MSSNREIEAVRKQIRFLQVTVTMLVLVGSALLLMAAKRGPQIVRAKGIVIVDDQGRARILMGAPVPEDSQRTRKDASTESLVFLGPDGSDRVLVGQTPDPYVQGKAYKRIGEAWGMLIADPKGSERGGFAFLDNGRAIVSLDRQNGDAVAMYVDDVGNEAGIGINYPAQKGLGGGARAFDISAQDNDVTMLMRDPTGRTRANLKVSSVDDRPTLDLRDAAIATK